MLKKPTKKCPSKMAPLSRSLFNDRLCEIHHYVFLISLAKYSLSFLKQNAPEIIAHIAAANEINPLKMDIFETIGINVIDHKIIKTIFAVIAAITNDMDILNMFFEVDSPLLRISMKTSCYAHITPGFSGEGSEAALKANVGL